MDCSNFLKAIPFTFKSEVMSYLVYLKSKVGCKVIVKAVALAAKLYSILFKGRVSKQHLTKSALKGCPTRFARDVYIHQALLDVLYKEGYQPLLVRSNHIRRDKATGVNTVHVVKRCLTFVENKRW